MVMCPSAAGYDRDAAKLVPQYESCPFASVFEKILSFFPSAPCRVLDIGAGSGRDAAALARRGHTVVAVEPSDGMREAGKSLHGDAPVTWLDDALPDLPALRAREYAAPYDFVLIQAVWMHLDEGERETSMKRLAELLAPGGRAVVSLRHGPVPEGRRMFAITPEETADLARRNGLNPVRRVAREDLHGREDISWTFICLEKPAA